MIPVEKKKDNMLLLLQVFAEIVREMNLKNSSKDREIICTCCTIS
jgi:hypothetical protein